MNVIYTQDVSSLRLQWQLQSDIIRTTIVGMLLRNLIYKFFNDSDQFTNFAGYEIILSKNDALPESLWNRFVIQGPDSMLLINNLDAGSKYYARINVKLINGTTLSGSTTYQFATLGNNLESRNTFFSSMFENL